MNAWSLSLFALAACLLWLSASILRRYQRSQSISFYAAFLAALAAIAIIQGALFLEPSPSMALTLTRLGYVAGVLTFSMLLLFTWHFPLPSQNIPKRSDLFWILPVVFFLPFVLFNTSFVSKVTQDGYFWRETLGSSFWIFPIFVATYVIWSLTNLVNKFHFVQGPQRGSMQMFILALILASLSGLAFDVLLPAGGRPRIPIGIYSSSILFGLSTYIVTRK